MRRHSIQWLSILLVCISSMVFSSIASAADDSHKYTDNPIAKHFLKPQDYSLGYLKQMFGSMDGMIQSNTGGSLGGFIMGDMFAVLNSTVLMFGLILLMYIVFTATLKTAHEGEVMGRNWSSPWIMLRAAGAMVLLMPQKATGYCLAQKVVMMIVLLGVAAANAMWSTAVDKMLSVSTVKAIIKDQAGWSNGKLLTPIQAMYQQIVCRDTLRKHYGNGKVDIYGPFYSYNGRIPNVTYDTAMYSIFTKKNFKDWWYAVAGMQVAADAATGVVIGGITNGFGGVLTGAQTGYKVGRYETNTEFKATDDDSSLQQQRTGVKPNDTNESRIVKPLCGGVWWTIPYYSVPVMQTMTRSDEIDTYNDNKDNVAATPTRRAAVAAIKLEAKLEKLVPTIYHNFMYAGYNFHDEAIETADDKADKGWICGDKTTEVGANYGCFVQSVQQYEDVVRDAMNFAKANSDYLKHYATHAHRFGKNSKYGTIDDDGEVHDGVDLRNALRGIKTMIKQQGWANAGSYFYNIVQLTSSGYLSPIQLNVMPMYVTDKKSIKHLQDAQVSANNYLEASYQKLNDYYISDQFAEYNEGETAPSQMTKRQEWLMRIRQHIRFDMSDQQLGGNSRLIFDVMSFGIINLGRQWTNHLVNTISVQAMNGAKNSGAGMVNPIISLQNLGRVQMAEVHDIWINGLATIEGITLGAAGVAIVSDAAIPISQGVTSIINWVQSIMQPIAIMLFGSGFLLAVWLPFMPYVLALFCVFGWLIAVVEMMVAAPIIAVGILSPDNGHELLGKGAAAVTLAMGIFLRPMLMILGFIAAMIGIYIASDLVNSGFLHMINSVFKNRLNVLTTVGLISLYAMIMTTLCNKSFGMMHVISNRVLRWIGGHNATFENGEEGSLGEAKGAISSTGDKGSQGAGNMNQPPSKSPGKLATDGVDYLKGKMRERNDKKLAEGKPK